MIFILFSLFLEIKDASSLVGLDNNYDVDFSLTFINYYNIPELSGFRLKGDKIFLYDVSIFGFSYYNEIMMGIGKVFSLKDIEIRFVPYFILFNAGDIKNYGFTEDFYLKFKYLNFEVGLVLKNLLFFFKDEITPVEEIFLSYKIDNFKHNFKISYYFEDNINFQYGMEVNAIPLIIRLGFNTNPCEPSFGFGISKKRMRFDFSFLSHPLLGFTENFTFSFIK